MATNEITKNISTTENTKAASVSNPRREEDLKSTAQTIKSAAKDKAGNVLDNQKNMISAGLSDVADSIRQVGDNLLRENEENDIARMTARYGDSLAEKVESFSDYVERTTLQDLTRDVEGLARRQPVLFIGGAFIAGLMAARFLKTSAPKRNSDNPRTVYSDLNEKEYKARRNYSSAGTV